MISELKPEFNSCYLNEADNMFDSKSRNLPVALTIAGSDSGGGAGIQADLKTFAAHAVFGTSVITCTTAQNPDGVISVQELEVSHIRDQLRQVLEYFDVRAIKTGMLYSESIIRAVAEVLVAHPDIPIVLDPVMVATSGAVLLEPQAVDALKKQLFPLTTIITPNLEEAKVLTGKRPGNQQSMINAACKLAESMQKTILLKGGHLKGQKLTDILAFPEGNYQLFSSTKVEEIDSHGSGCTLASAIAAEIANGNTIENAVKKAHRYLQSSFQNPIRVGDTFFLNHFV
jgi:hydroxymethylpyrimidine/phosphomethylpyrimidine kinase